MNKLVLNIGDHYNTPWGGISNLGFANLVSIVISNAVIIASIILLFLLIGGGISMIAGAGGNNPEGAARGRKAVTSAVIGFAIIFTTYWIGQIIRVLFGFPFGGFPMP